MNMYTMINRYKNMTIMAKAAFWALVANIFQKGVGIIVTPIFTRLLTTEEYAQYTLFQSWHDIFIIFTTLNVFNYATYTAMLKFKEERNDFIASAQSLITIISLGWFAIYSILHFLLGEIIGFSYVIMMLMFVDMLFIASFNLWCTKERYVFHYKLMTLLSLIIGVMGPLLGVFFIQMCPIDNGNARIFGVVIVDFVIGFIIYIYNFAVSSKRYNTYYWKYIFSYCIPLIPHFLATQILSRFDRIMIDSISGKAQSGIYSLAYSISMLMLIINDAILKTLTSWTYQAIEQKKSIKKLINQLLLIVAAANILLILFAPEMIAIFATNEYYEAIYIIPSVSASVFFIFLSTVIANIEYYFSETKYVAIASSGAAVLNIILNYIFINLYGFIAAGYTTLLCYVIYTICHYFIMQFVIKRHKMEYQPYDNRFMLLISVILIVIALLMIPLYKVIYLRYVLIAIIVIITILNKNNIVRVVKQEKID